MKAKTILVVNSAFCWSQCALCGSGFDADRDAIVLMAEEVDGTHPPVCPDCVAKGRDDVELPTVEQIDAAYALISDWHDARESVNDQCERDEISYEERDAARAVLDDKLDRDMAANYPGFENVDAA